MFQNDTPIKEPVAAENNAKDEATTPVKSSESINSAIKLTETKESTTLPSVADTTNKEELAAEQHESKINQDLFYPDASNDEENPKSEEEPKEEDEAEETPI